MHAMMAAIGTLLSRSRIVRGGTTSELIGRYVCSATNGVTETADANGCEQKPIRVTVIEGEGTGPVVCAAVRKIFKAAAVQVEWDFQTMSVHRDHRTNRMVVNPEVINSATETGLVLRAQSTVVGLDSVQLSGTLVLNKALNAFLGVRKFVSFAGHEPYGAINLVNIRDNVSAEYSEIEHLVVPGVVQSIKTVSRKNSMAVARLAFDYATEHGHGRITTLHKANVMPLSDGMFLKACRDVSACYPDVEYGEEKLDTFCLQVTTNPGRYDVLLTTSLYGAFAGATCATMCGGLAMVPSASYGPVATVFSTMSDYGHGYGSCGGQRGAANGFDRDPIANPTGMVRAATWLLRHAGAASTGRLIDAALEDTVRQGVCTRDMGGEASCSQFTDAVIKNLEALTGMCNTWPGRNPKAVRCTRLNVN